MIPKKKRPDLVLIIPVIFATILSVIVLRSIAPSLFPLYFIYILLGMISFYIFSNLDYRITEALSPAYYITGILLLIITLVIGKVTRGVVRWIPLGGISIQPAEVLRPFFLVFFAYFYSKNKLNINTFVKALLLILLAATLIFIQPSLGVTVITLIGFLGITISAGFNKKILIVGGLLLVILLPLTFLILAPYQKERITTFLNPNKDPLGAGYNSIQSMISVGSGKIIGRGIGRGVQTQLAFLPERHTDFVFASVSEELGFLGAIVVLISLFLILYRITVYIESSVSPSARAYVTGVFFALSTQIIINMAMNLGFMPIAGLPLPIISAGGSSYLGTMILLGIASSVRKS